MQHVYGHADESLSEEEMSPEQRVNCRAKKLATAALIVIAAVDTNEFISSIFPAEKVCVEISGERITGSPKNAITDLLGEQVTRALQDRRGVVRKCDFPFVYWEGMERVMKSFPEMFWVWVTKHVSHFQGTNCQLSRISKSVKNVCPSCGCHDGATSHITRCQDRGRSQLFAESVEQLVQCRWLVDQQTDSKILYLFKRYLLACGIRTLTSLLKPGSKLGVELRFHDRLGWDCFLEGRLCALWVEHKARHIKRSSLTRSANIWARGLIRRLLQMTHAQWVYRNATVHLEVKEGRTTAAHETILATMEGFLHNNLEQLLEEHCHLLF